MLAQGRMTGRRIAVTGASSGIGRAAAIQLAKRGAEVLLIARRAEELEKLCAEILAQGGQAKAYPADLADFESLDAMAERLLAEHGKIDVLVNNAGRSIRRPLVKSFDRFHDFERTMQLNYFAAVRLSMMLLPAMLADGNGHIINVSTWGTLFPSPLFAAYGASKSALDSFTRSLGSELGDRGIAATSIHYPLVKTPMIIPTKHYRSMPGMSPEWAASWIVKAVDTRRARIAPKLILAAGINSYIFPKFAQKVARRIGL